ncbi:MAG: polysaccharide biosynthesis protein [Lachnospiraceae bacterium]|nr:polysaccharide biosynthesis protein [Lachnospiraceae bacterium]
MENKNTGKPASGGVLNNFITQAGILAAAGFISRIIGLLYTSPLSGIIGDLGLGYYTSAYNYYTIILLISSYSIPSAISKVMAGKLGAGEYKNAHRLFIGALIYVLVIGAAASAFLYFGAGLFVEPAAVPVLRTFAPTIFIYGILGVLRGYFQAHKNMVPTSVSQIFEQIANAAVSVGAAYFLITYTTGHSLFGMQPLETISSDLGFTVSRAVRGAIGSALGTGTGVVIALVFMFIAYMKSRASFKNQIASDPHKNVDSAGSIIKMITLIVTPFILSTAISNLASTVNNKLFTSFYPAFRNLDPVTVTSHWGIFSGKSMKISNIPIAFASAMAAAMIPQIAQLIAANKKEESKQKIGLAVKATMLISIPCAVGLFVLAAPITLLLYPNTLPNIELAKYSLMALSLSVVFYALSTLNSSVLQGLGKVVTPIINAGVALVIQTVAGISLLFFTDLDVFSIAITSTLYSAIIAILNQLAVRKHIGYKQEIPKTFVLPFFASIIMGGAAYGVYRLVLMATNSARVSVIPAIIISVPVYFVALLLVRAVNEEELKSFPKGNALVKLAKRLHLLT